MWSRAPQYHLRVQRGRKGCHEALELVHGHIGDPQAHGRGGQQAGAQSTSHRGASVPQRSRGPYSGIHADEHAVHRAVGRVLTAASIIRPFRKDFVDGRVVYRRFPMGACRHRQALPLHPRIQDPQDQVKDLMIAQFTLGSALGHGEVRQDKCRELRFGELDRNRRLCGLWGRGAHQARASCEESGYVLENQIM